MRNNYADTDAHPTLLDSVGAANTAVVHTIAADANQFWCLDWITWSYSEAPTAGRLSVTINGVLVYDVDITAGGPGMLNFVNALYTGVVNQVMVVTLAAAGGTCVGKLNLRYR